MKKIITSEKAAPILIVSAAYIARLLFYFQHPVQWRDSYRYVSLIESLELNGVYLSFLENRNYNYIPPFPIYLFKTIHRLFGSSIFVSGISFQIFIGTLLVYIIWQICTTLKIGPIKSLLVCSVAVVHHTLLDYSTQLTRDNLYLFFFTLTVYLFLVYLKKRDVVLLVLSGACSCLSFLCRYEGIEIVFLYVVAIGFISSQRILHKTGAIIIYLLSFLITAAVLNQVTAGNDFATEAFFLKIKHFIH